MKRAVGPGWNGRVYAVVRLVPPGRVATYGQIATLLGSPRVARHVGWALSACAESEPPVPWHRIINAQGRVSVRGEDLRAGLQRTLLEQEGVEFDAHDRVDLAQLRWPFPDFELPHDPVDPGATG
jgi:methylated-DNA-protein-cysteine methyltransferase-like protein